MDNKPQSRDGEPLVGKGHAPDAIEFDANYNSHDHPTQAPPAPSSLVPGGGGGLGGAGGPNYQSSGRPPADRSRMVSKLQKYTLYETKTKFIVIASNSRETLFRKMEIDIAPLNKEKLAIEVDPMVYTRSDIMDVLADLLESSDSLGVLEKRVTALGIIGFIRFSDCYYMSVITKRSIVALLGGHYIYHIDATELIPIASSSTYRKPDRTSEEARYLLTLQNLDLSKTFYFSYTYDITNTLQCNIIHEKERALDPMNSINLAQSRNEMFIWNDSLMKPAFDVMDNVFDWCVPVLHGFIDQAKISVLGRSVYLTLIARRSHHFAGARFLKRGVNGQGNVANEVESEQIVSDQITTSFHSPTTGFYNNPRYSSYVQHRGSIPLYWSQDMGNMSPKPPIHLNRIDPFFSAAALHFDDMFKRYGPPILVLNLIKRKEKLPRESVLGQELEQCINYLNQFLPQDKKIEHTAWDMSRASKSRDSDVIGFLDNYASEAIAKTGFFHNGKDLKGMSIQTGIVRTNCIDCLDRTNAAQFIIGKRVLGFQLQALGITDTSNLDYDCDAVNLLTEMYHDHGDTIALQYGGSHLVNTMETYRKINQWTSHSRDMIESIRRFYSNSFVDSQRQDAINLFLGNYVFRKGQPMLWDLATDYYLHNDLFGATRVPRRSYRYWWTEANLRSIRDTINKFEDEFINEYDASYEDASETELALRKYTRLPTAPYAGFFDNFWNENYRARALTSFSNVFTYNINSTLRYIQSPDLLDISPFQTRKPLRDHSKRSERRSNSNAMLLSTIHSAAATAAATDNNKPESSRGSNNLKSMARAVTDSSSSSQGLKVSSSSSSMMRIEAIKRASKLYQNPPSLQKLIISKAWPRASEGNNDVANSLPVESGDFNSSTPSESLDSVIIDSPQIDTVSVYASRPVRDVVRELSNPAVRASELSIYEAFVGVRALDEHADDNNYHDNNTQNKNKSTAGKMAASTAAVKKEKNRLLQEYRTYINNNRLGQFSSVARAATKYDSSKATNTLESRYSVYYDNERLLAMPPVNDSADKSWFGMTELRNTTAPEGNVAGYAAWLQSS